MKKREEARPLNKTLMNAIISSVLAVASVILLILLSFTLFLLTDSTFLVSLPVRPYSYYIAGGIATSAVLLVISLIFLFRNIEAMSLEVKESGLVQQEETETKTGEKEEELLRYLDGGEREIYSILVDAGGALLQRDITSVKGYSKATITRILNRLESKGVVERMRHGTTNKIVLKRVSK